MLKETEFSTESASMRVRVGNNMRAPTLLMGLLFLAAGGLFTYFKTWPDYQLAKESKAWLSTMGEVTKSEIISRRETTGTGTSRRRTTKYRPDIHYNYEVEGRKYNSSQIYIGSKNMYSGGTGSFSIGGFSVFSGGRSSARKYTTKYPVGKEVTVYYSPKDESNAVLEPGVKNSHYMFLGLSLLFTVLGFFMVTKGSKKS